MNYKKSIILFLAMAFLHSVVSPFNVEAGKRVLGYHVKNNHNNPVTVEWGTENTTQYVCNLNQKEFEYFMINDNDGVECPEITVTITLGCGDKEVYQLSVRDHDLQEEIMVSDVIEGGNESCSIFQKITNMDFQIFKS